MRGLRLLSGGFSIVDDEPREVWTSPPATHAEILERHPDAIAAEPFETKPSVSAAPIHDDLERLIARAGTFYEYNPDDYALIRTVSRRDPDGLRLALENDVAFREAFEERAAILEYDAGLSREEAEHQAMQTTGGGKS